MKNIIISMLSVMVVSFLLFIGDCLYSLFLHNPQLPPERTAIILMAVSALSGLIALFLMVLGKY